MKKVTIPASLAELKRTEPVINFNNFTKEDLREVSNKEFYDDLRLEQQEQM